ncbi:hypothetical protein DFQ28_011646 [Apophysomyces sp. BC1034]|nr:hypothetical protein DFQ28_011646 [Apophysomyces sp. BC1034]
MFEPEMALFAEKLKEMNIKFYIETTELAYDEDILNDLFVFAKDVDLPIDTQDSIPLLKELGLALSVAHSR